MRSTVQISNGKAKVKYWLDNQITLDWHHQESWIWNPENPVLFDYEVRVKAEKNGDVTDEMVARIKEMGYPEDRFAYRREEIGGHETSFWRGIFSEYLNAMVYQGR